MGSREERIASLASTLRSSGVAKSDAQARMMAEEMIGVEEHVQKRFDEEHHKAQEFLSASKNLGTAGVMRAQPKKEEPARTMPAKQDGVLVRPIERFVEKPIEKIAQVPIEKPALPVEKPVLKPLDLDIQVSGPELVTPIVHESRPVDEEVHEKAVPLEPVHTDETYGNKSLKDLMLNQIKEEFHEIKNIEEMQPTDATIAGSNVSTESGIKTADKISDVTSDTSSVQSNVESTHQDAPRLDSQKLVELMEEDGKLEEHTREIKEKPKVIKPKEEYAENSIDLSAMFNVHK